MSYYYNFHSQQAPTPEITAETAPATELKWWLESTADEIFSHFATFGEKLDQPDKRHVFIDNGAQVLHARHTKPQTVRKRIKAKDSSKIGFYL